MHLTFVPKSSAIALVQYNNVSKELYITYTGSPTPYCYYGVPVLVAERLYATHLAGGSVGTYVLRYIRRVYPHSEVQNATNVVRFRARDTVRVKATEQVPASVVVSNAYAERVRKLQQETNAETFSIYRLKKP